MSLVVYPGTFDPLTLGHQDVVNRVAAHHESVVVAISDSRSNTLFTMAERVDMAKAILVGLPNVRVMPFSGLVTDFACDIGASLIVRGLRDASDFDYERRPDLVPPCTRSDCEAELRLFPRDPVRLPAWMMHLQSDGIEGISRADSRSGEGAGSRRLMGLLALRPR